MSRRRSRLSTYRQNKLLELFVAGTPARTAAELVGINRHSATLYYHKLREMIACELEDQSPFEGEIEVDESYFGGHPSMQGMHLAALLFYKLITHADLRGITFHPPDMDKRVASELRDVAGR